MKGFGLAALGVVLALISAAPALAAGGGRLAFASGDPFHIWTIKPNGNALRDISAGAPADKIHCAASLSPDGARIAYVDLHADPLAPVESGHSSLIVANSDGTNPRVIAGAWVSGYFCLDSTSWSPDGRKVAYAGSGATTTTPTAVMTIDVDNPVALPREISDRQHMYYTALWSPDGTRIAADGDDGHEHVFSLDPSGPDVVSDRYGCGLTSWSRDSTHLLEACDQSTTQAKGTWRVRAGDLGDPAPVYLGAAYDGTYSPDGTRVALRLDNALYTMPADGSAAPTLVTSRDVYGISWSR